MGTRHLQTVINKEGKLIINQYGQWDGYPEGQGKKILNYLRTADLVKYQENLNRIHPVTDADIEKVNEAGDGWKEKYPFLSRDCGSDIHKMIEEGNVPFVGLISQEEANSWCEGFYTIDFSKGLFISEYGSNSLSVPLDNLPTDAEYLEFMNKDEEE